MTLSDNDLLREWHYRYEERLGILCGTAEPMPEQDKIASDEADAAVEALRASPAGKDLTPQATCEMFPT